MATYRASERGQTPDGVWRKPGDTFEYEGAPGKWMEPVEQAPPEDKPTGRKPVTGN